MNEINEFHRGRLIVTADDFGVSPRANRNILYLISLGKIDRVAAMVNGKITPQEIDELARSGVKIDIHLDILHEFHEDRKNRQSALGRSLEFFGKLVFRKITTKKVARDWEKQIKKFHELFGKYPDGLNSHEHVHFFPPFFKIALTLGDKYTIPYIRFGNSISLTHHSLVSHILHYLRKINMHTCLKHKSCVSSGSMISLDWIENVEQFLQNLPEGTIEIAAHPEVAQDFEKIKKYF